MWECCSKLMLAGVIFGTHPRNPRNPRQWCHEVRFRCLLPRAPVGQDDGSLGRLPQMRRYAVGHWELRWRVCMKRCTEEDWRMSWWVDLKLRCRSYLTFASVVGSVVCFRGLHCELSCRLYPSFVSVVCIWRLLLSFDLGLELAFVSVMCSFFRTGG